MKQDNFIKLIKTKGNNDHGYLSYFESSKDIPFEIKRIYYIYDVPVGSIRGMHAHKKLSQLIWCPFGKIEIVLDNSFEKMNYILDSPDKALLVLQGYWREMYWVEPDSVLCVAASDYYDEEDYIRDYDDFLEYAKRGYWDHED